MKQRRPYKSFEFFAMPPVPMLVEGLISRRGVTGLSADPGVGKTFFALEIIRSLLEADTVMNRFKSKRGSVLFVGQDCSEAQYAEQARKVFHDLLEKDSSLLSGVQWFLHAGLDLTKAVDVALVINAAKNVPDLAYDPEVPVDWVVGDPVEVDGVSYASWDPVYGDPNGASLIVIDTLSTVHRADENHNSQMTQVMGAIRSIAEQTGAAILLLHHHSYGAEHNPGNRWRGASSQVALLDAHFELQGKGQEKKLIVRKFRGIPPKDFKFEMFTTEHHCWFEFGEEITVKADGREASWIEEALDEFLANFGQGDVITNQQLIEHFVSKRNISDTTAKKRASECLQNLQKQQRVKPLKRGSWELSLSPIIEEQSNNNP